MEISNFRGGFKIKSVKAREILDCRGEPTLQVEVTTEDGTVGRADVPAGRSTGKYEALDLRDGGSRYGGRGVLKAARNVNESIQPALKGVDVTRQREIDSLLIKLDGTENKSRLGANAIVGVSLAVARAAANIFKIPLYRYIGGPNSHIMPVPLLNYVNGGRLAATELDFQEHIIIPVGFKTFSEAMRASVEVYHELGKILVGKYGRHSLNVADEGGYTPPGMNDPREAFDTELEAVENLGYGGKYVLGLDAAASHLYDEKTERYRLMSREYSREELIDYYVDLASTYPIQSIEDPLHEDDFEGFAELTKRLNIQIVGDDLFVTNMARLRRGISVGAGNALLLKVNQVGTLSEAFDAAETAFRNRYGVQVSERSGQTEDTWLADLAVALNAGQIKTGAPCRSERTAQYNRLLIIEEELGSQAFYPGVNFRQPFL
ncbi:phosphopyruvate hydratase [Candidatus Bathyarchaeota archaeon]|nr:phosphopyruvate hydratase [Candidatus Bathyarchaeota archaeon]